MKRKITLVNFREFNDLHNKCGIYRIDYKKSKFYIGMTEKPLIERLRVHLTSTHNENLNNLIKTKSLKDFEITILHLCEIGDFSNEELLKMEHHEINRHTMQFGEEKMLNKSGVGTNHYRDLTPEIIEKMKTTKSFQGINVSKNNRDSLYSYFKSVLGNRYAFVLAHYADVSDIEEISISQLKKIKKRIEDLFVDGLKLYYPYLIFSEQSKLFSAIKFLAANDIDTRLHHLSETLDKASLILKAYYENVIHPTAKEINIITGHDVSLIEKVLNQN